MLHTEAVNSLIKGEGEEVIWSNQQGISFQFLIFFFFIFLVGLQFLRD